MICYEEKSHGTGTVGCFRLGVQGRHVPSETEVSPAQGEARENPPEANVPHVSFKCIPIIHLLRKVPRPKDKINVTFVT